MADVPRVPPHLCQGEEAPQLGATSLIDTLYGTFPHLLGALQAAAGGLTSAPPRRLPMFISHAA